MWLVTAGPTREYLDDVRFLSNASSGRMGYALARAARARGHEVVLVSGPVELPPPDDVRVLPVQSADEMLAVGRQVLAQQPADCLFGVAAVCDFRPTRRVSGKPPKERGRFSLELCENPDVLATLAGLGQSRFAAGFALEDLGQGPDGLAAAVARARAKLERKGLSAIVLNGTETLGAAAAHAYWVEGSGAIEPLQGDKTRVARLLVQRVEVALESG
jgi:phosphopantothenoylcysteine decarboxylase/phosphopantothenate--cysteine ligase